jgi:integrase/recombinase XerC
LAGKLEARESVKEATGTALVVADGDNLSASRSAPLAFDAPDLLEMWLAGKNEKTVRAYRGDLEAFARWAGAASMESALEAFLTLPAPAANGAALRYRGALLDSGLATATVNRRLAALRSAVSLARLVGRVSWALEVPGVEAAPYRDTRGCGVDGFRAMVRTVEGRGNARSLRDRALLRLLFDVGLRRAEVVEMDAEHFDATAGTLSVLGKKRRSRELVTLPAPTRAALVAWLEVRGSEPGPLFRNFDRAGKSERLTGRSVARIVAEVSGAAGIGLVRPHGLRHAAITHALDVTGGDVRRVQKFSRHRDLRTLTVYDDNRQDIAGQVAALIAGVC